MLNRTIKIGKIDLTLGINNGLKRYEGVSQNSRVLVRQDPWGTWSASFVKRNGKGAIVNIGGFESPEEAGKALIENTEFFGKCISEFIETNNE